MAKMYWEKDANPKALAGKRVAVLGYGSQGRAQALNLRDSGLDVVLGQRPGGPSGKLAEQDGWKLLSAAEASKGADVIVMLTPDMTQPSVFKNDVRPQSQRRRHAPLLARLQHPLRPDRAAKNHRRHHDRSQEPR